MNFLKLIRNKILSLLGLDRGPNLEDLKERGMKVGKMFIYDCASTRFDSSHCWLIEIGDYVTFGPGVYLLAHDASTKQYLGYTKIGHVIIKDHTFIGANTIVMPGVTVGGNCIIGAASVVTHDVPDGCVYAGNPAKMLCTTQEYIDKQRRLMEKSPVFEAEYTLGKGIDAEKKREMKEKLSDTNGFVF